jgi:hypothetical protein
MLSINAAIVGLRAGQFRSHLMRERPKTIQRLYKEFEKYCRSKNDFRMCMEDLSQQKKFAKANNPAKESGPIPETPRMPTLETFSASTARTPKKIPIRRVTPRIKPIACPVHHIQIKGGTEAEGAAAEVEVAAKAEATTRKENGIASSTRRMTIIVQITAQTRKDSRLFLKKKGRRRRGLVP